MISVWEINREVGAAEACGGNSGRGETLIALPDPEVREAGLCSNPHKYIGRPGEGASVPWD